MLQLKFTLGNAVHKFIMIFNCHFFTIVHKNHMIFIHSAYWRQILKDRSDLRRPMKTATRNGVMCLTMV